MAWNGWTNKGADQGGKKKGQKGNRGKMVFVCKTFARLVKGFDRGARYFLGEYQPRGDKGG